MRSERQAQGSELWVTRCRVRIRLILALGLILFAVFCFLLPSEPGTQEVVTLDELIQRGTEK